jgi:hypothetical protein
MSEKPEDKFIDELFKDSIGNIETQPSDQFWNKAYDSILQNENSVYQKRILRLRSVSIVLGLAVAGLIGYNVYTSKKVNDIEQKVAGLERKQLQAANNESRSVDALANSLNGNSAIQGSQPVAQQNIQSNTTAAVQRNVIVANTQLPVKQAASAPERQFPSSGGRKFGNVPATTIAYHNASAQSNEALETNVTQGVNSMIYLEEKTSITIPPPDNSDSILLAMDAEDSVETVKPIVVRIKEQISPLKPKEHPKVSLSAYFGPSLADPVMKDNNTSDNITPAAVKAREHEQPASTCIAGVNADISPTSTSRFSVQLGCEYRSYKFSLSPSSINTTTGDMNSGYQYFTSSGTINMPYIPGYTPFGYYDTVATANGTAKRAYIDIPLHLKYKFIQSRKLSVYASVGGSMNILVCNYATIHCQNNWGEEDISLYNIQGAKTINFSYVLGLGIERKLGNGVSIFAEPSYSAAVTPNTSNSPITTYSNYFDLALGVSYRF